MMPNQEDSESIYIDPVVAGMDADRLAELRRAVLLADEADVILLSGLSRQDWLGQIDRTLANFAASGSSKPGAS